MDCALIPPPDCPGRYCGRTLIENGSSCYSNCGTCRLGYRVSLSDSECVSCDDGALLRDYLFLGFVYIICLSVRLGILATVNVDKDKVSVKIGLAGVTVIENVLALLFTLLILEPQGSLHFNACRVRQVSDFYPIFFNPTRDYVHHLSCSYEVVYPLYRMIFIYFGFYFLFHILLLSVTIPYLWYFRTRLRQATEFAWLIALPIILTAFAVLAGILYYIFDYLIVIASIGGFAVISTLNQAIKYSFKMPFKVFLSPDHCVFTLVCMTLLAYGILSLTEIGSIEFRSKLLPSVLALPFFHIVLSYLASPLPYLTAWGIDCCNCDYNY